jgi:acyl transferase domain-containing protein
MIEIQAINDVFGSSHTAAQPLLIGAAKSCVGHTETAAGLVGVVKTVASFAHNLVPGLTHLTSNNLNPRIDCTVVPILIPDNPVDLQPSASVPRALVLCVDLIPVVKMG